MIEASEYERWGPDMLSVLMDEFDWNNPVTINEDWESQVAPGVLGLCIMLAEYMEDKLFVSQWKPLLSIFENINKNTAPDTINAIWRKWVADMWMLTELVIRRKQSNLIQRDFDMMRSVIQNEAIVAAIEDSLGFCDSTDEE